MDAWVLAGIALVVGVWIGWEACWIWLRVEIQRPAPPAVAVPPPVLEIDVAFCAFALRQLGAEVTWPQTAGDGARVH